MVNILNFRVTGYGITLEVSKHKHTIRRYFIGNNLILFLVLCLNILNCCYFHTDRSTFSKNDERWENKKKLRKCDFYIKK